MPPSGSFISFATVACKLALVLTTIGYAGVVAHRMREQNAQLKKAMGAARAERDQLLEQIASMQEDATRMAEKKQEDAEFWCRMEGFARTELMKKDVALRQAEEEIVAQRERDLQTRLRDAPAASLEQASRVASSSHVAANDVPPAISSFDDVVLHMVRTLNLEISEVASQVTNAFHVAQTHDPDNATLAFDRAREAVGPVMAELLESIQHQEDPILIDIALKADMVGFAAEIASAWDFQHQSKSVFTGVYKQMRRSGTRSVLFYLSP